MLVYSQLCMRAKAVSCFRSERLCNDIIEAVAVVLHCSICKDIMARNTQPMLTMNSLTSILVLVRTNSEAANDLIVLCTLCILQSYY